MVLFFIGGIIVTAILIDKSPTALLTGLGASAAVLMLVFKDSILGFVAGAQLSQNNMIQWATGYRCDDPPTNSRLYRVYIERYLRNHPTVAQELDLIIAQRQQGEFGLKLYQLPG